MKNSSELSIAFVVYSSDNLALLKKNYYFIKKLNPQIKVKWIVTDNSLKNKNLKLKEFTVIRGVKPPTNSFAKASFHHALGINKQLKYIKTRFALFLDCDFFITRKNWISEVLDYMKQNELAFFGAPYHPKWYGKYRYFPCGHCLFIDFSRVNKSDIDFQPNYNSNQKANNNNKQFTVSEFSIPFKGILIRLADIYKILLLKDRSQIYKSQDTGYRIYRKFYQNPSFKHQSTKIFFDLNKEFKGPKYALTWINQSLEKLLPERLTFLPKRKNYYINSQGYLSKIVPQIKDFEYEEYLWEDQTFGFHIRGTVRKNYDLKNDILLVKKILKKLKATFIQT